MNKLEYYTCNSLAMALNIGSAITGIYGIYKTGADVAFGGSNLELILDTVLVAASGATWLASAVTIMETKPQGAFIFCR